MVLRCEDGIVREVLKSNGEGCGNIGSGDMQLAVSKLFQQPWARKLNNAYKHKHNTRVRRWTISIKVLIKRRAHSSAIGVAIMVPLESVKGFNLRQFGSPINMQKTSFSGVAWGTK